MQILARLLLEVVYKWSTSTEQIRKKFKLQYYGALGLHLVKSGKIFISY